MNSYFDTNQNTFAVATCFACGYYHSVHPDWLKLPEPRTLTIECPHCGEETENRIREAKFV